MWSTLLLFVMRGLHSLYSRCTHAHRHPHVLSNAFHMFVPFRMLSPSRDRWQTETQRTALVARSLKIFAVTWNVNELLPDLPKGDAKGDPAEGPPAPSSSAGSSFFAYLRDHVATKSEYKLAVIGLQEIEMGSTSVAAAAARDLFGQRKAVERGNQAAQAWAQRLLGAMNEGDGAWFKVGLWSFAVQESISATLMHRAHCAQVGMRQLCGILVCVFARVELRPVIGEVATAHVTTGVLGNRGGNKGAVALRFSLWRRTFTVIVSHFAAHQHNIDERNANYQSIVRRLKFKRHIVHPTLERLHRAGERAGETARQRERGGEEEESEVSDSESDEEAGLGEEEVRPFFCLFVCVAPWLQARTCTTFNYSQISRQNHHTHLNLKHNHHSTLRRFGPVRRCCGLGTSIIGLTWTTPPRLR